MKSPRICQKNMRGRRDSANYSTRAFVGCNPITTSKLEQRGDETGDLAALVVSHRAASTCLPVTINHCSLVNRIPCENDTSLVANSHVDIAAASRVPVSSSSSRRRRSRLATIVEDLMSDSWESKKNRKKLGRKQLVIENANGGRLRLDRAIIGSVMIMIIIWTILMLDSSPQTKAR